MEITYELEKEDIIKVRWYRIFINPLKSDRNLRRFMIGFIIAVGIHHFLFLGQQYFLVNRIVVSILLMIAYWLFYEIMGRLIAFYSVRQNIPKSGLLCQHTITLTETELINKTDVNEARFSWHSIQGIEENDDYILIISSTLHHIIPKRAFSDRSECDAFYEFVKNKVPQKN